MFQRGEFSTRPYSSLEPLDLLRYPSFSGSSTRGFLPLFLDLEPDGSYRLVLHHGPPSRASCRGRLLPVAEVPSSFGDPCHLLRPWLRRVSSSGFLLGFSDPFGFDGLGALDLLGLPAPGGKAGAGTGGIIEPLLGFSDPGGVSLFHFLRLGLFRRSDPGWGKEKKEGLGLADGGIPGGLRIDRCSVAALHRLFGIPSPIRMGGPSLRTFLEELSDPSPTPMAGGPRHDPISGGLPRLHFQ